MVLVTAKAQVLPASAPVLRTLPAVQGSRTKSCSTGRWSILLVQLAKGAACCSWPEEQPQPRRAVQLPGQVKEAPHLCWRWPEAEAILLSNLACKHNTGTGVPAPAMLCLHDITYQEANVAVIRATDTLQDMHLDSHNPPPPPTPAGAHRGSAADPGVLPALCAQRLKTTPAMEEQWCSHNCSPLPLSALTPMHHTVSHPLPAALFTTLCIACTAATV